MSQCRFSLLPSLLLLLAVPALADDPPSSTAASPPAAAPVDLSTTKSNGDDLARQLADTQDKLTTALHSYSLLQDENTQLKADAEKSTAEKASLDTQFAEANSSITALKSQAAAATQVDGLRDQLRQAQNQIAALATENAKLRTQLALMNSTPAGPVFPQRPSGGDSMGAMPAPPAPFSNSAAGETPHRVGGGGSLLPGAKTGAGANAAAQSDLSTSAPAPKAAPRTYTVVEGDSLSKISKKCYGTANRWNEILAANRGVIKNENTVVIGAKLTIP